MLFKKPALFGESVNKAQQHILSPECQVPQVVMSCIQYLDTHLDEEGLYRIPGSLAKVNLLKSQFTKNQGMDLFKLNPEAHDIATLLKMYFRESPDDISKYPNLLNVLCGHLARVASHCDSNRMDVHNLILCWGPTLRGDPQHLKNLIEYGQEENPFDE